MKLVKIVSLAAAAAGLALTTSCGSLGSSAETTPVPVVEAK